MTYTELVAAIESYTQNYESDFVANIPTFVKQAETRIYNTVQIPALRKNVTGTITAYDPVTNPRAMYLSCPNDFLSVFSIAVIDAGNYEYLLNKDVNFIRAAYPSASDTGLPKYYALFGPTVVSSAITDELSFILGPTPDANYDVELHYYYYPQSIVDAGTSWLGDNYDPVLLYGSLVEAYIYMKGEADMMTAYEKKYQDALAQLNRLGTGLERGDAYRDGQAKIKVNP
jgi:hypothetical protein